MVGLPKNPHALSSWLSARTKHGAYSGGIESPEHYVWRSMHARCKSPKANGYKYYGGRGIRVCSEWDSFEIFLLDVGTRPSKEHQLDRIDTNKDYNAKNCRWVTRSVQQKNKRTTRRWECNGQVGTLTEWADLLGISVQVASYRMKNWGTFERGKEWLLQKVK